MKLINKKLNLEMKQGEIVLLLGSLAIAGYMFIESFSFGSSAARFPRMVSLIVILCGVLLLFRNHLPSSLDPVFASSEKELDKRNSTVLRSIIVLSAGYVVLAYLIGLLWATPIFAISYGMAFNTSKISTFVTTVVTVAFVFGLSNLVSVPLREGLFHQMGVL